MTESAADYLIDCVRRRLRDGGVEAQTAELCAREIIHDLRQPYRHSALAEFAVDVGAFVQAADGTVGAPYWWLDGEPVMADEYDDNRPPGAPPLYLVKGASNRA